MRRQRRHDRGVRWRRHAVLFEGRRCAWRAMPAPAARRLRGRAASRTSSHGAGRGRTRGCAREFWVDASPAAAATATFSRSSCARKSRVSRCANSALIGRWARHVTPENAASATNFSQSADAMASVADASRPGARLQAATRAAIAGSPARLSDGHARRAAGRPDRAGPAYRGADIDAAGGEAHRRHVAGDQRAVVYLVLQRDDLVPSPIIGARRSAAAAVSLSLTVKSMRSTGPISSGSSVAWIGARCASPNGLSIRRSVCRSAARCAPRATK